MTHEPLSASVLSKLVGQIYDCALEPTRWTNAIEAVAMAFDGIGGAISVIDRLQPRLTAVYAWGLPEAWHSFHTQRNFGEDALRFFTLAQAQANFDPDAPLVISRVLDAAAYDAMPVTQEFANPLGLGDCMSVILQSSDAQFINVDLFRSSSLPPFEDTAIADCRLLAPHLRRAFAISALLDQKALEINAHEAALDKLRCGVVLVDATARVVFANTTAKQLLSAQSSIRLVQGILTAGETRQTPLLHAMIDDLQAKAPASSDIAPAVRLSG